MIRLQRLSVAAILAGALVGAPAALAQSGAPVAASIFFKNPPANLTFGPGTPIAIAVQVRNVAGASVNTTDGFSDTEFWRRLVFKSAAGALVANTDDVHRDEGTFYCYSRNGALVGLTALSVLPLEVLDSNFVVQYDVADARAVYDLSRSGPYSVSARFAFLKFDADQSTIIMNCDQFAGRTLVNMGAGAAGRQGFTIASNGLQFCINWCTFTGFATPLINNRTYRHGSTIPVKFQLLDGSGAPIGNAAATIGVVQVKGAPPPAEPIDLGTGAADTGNAFRFDPKSQQYIFNLDTKVLSPGVWRIDVKLDSGEIRSIQIGLR